MICFLSGGAKSGKSSLAQELALTLSAGGHHYYVATTIPSDEEDLERIRLHLLDREGMGFETVECGKNLLSVLESTDPSGTYLLDSATALLMNELFPKERNYEMDVAAAESCGRDLITFAKGVANAVIVSDYIYADAERYDSITETYRSCLARIDRQIAAISDTVIEMTAGQMILHKGVLPE